MKSFGLLSGDFLVAGLFSFPIGVFCNDVLIHLYYLGCCKPFLRVVGYGVPFLDPIETLRFCNSANLRFVSAISALIPPQCKAFTLFILNLTFILVFLEQLGILTGTQASISETISYSPTSLHLCS